MVTQGCAAPTAAPSIRPVLRIATAFAPLSQQLISEYRRALPHLDVQEYQAAASTQVLHALETNAADLGVALADDAYAAYWPRQSSSTTSSSQLRGVSLLQPLPAYLLVRSDSGITRVTDLRNRVVAVGPEGTSSWTLGRLVLEAFGVQGATIKAMSSRTAAAAGLKNGTLHAIFLPGFLYPDETTYSTIREGASLIPIEGAPLERMRWEHPFVRVVRVPRDIYPGQDRVVPTVGIDMVVVCRKDLSDGLVRELTEQLFKSFPRLSGAEATLKFLNMAEAPATPIPLHPGAARYFRERELLR